MTPTDLTVSIVNFNGERFLRPLFDSLGVPTRHSLEIRFWDNASTDRSVSVAQALAPRARVTVSPQNFYYARGNNLNLQDAESRYFVITNNDLEFLPDSIDAMADVLDREPAVGVVGPQVLTLDGAIQESGCRYPTVAYGVFEYLFLHVFFPNNPVARHYRYAGWDRRCRRSVEFVGGACLMVRASLFKQLRGFDDERFVFYGEESDFCRRAHGAGFDVVYEPRAKVKHHRAGTTRRLDPWMIYHLRHRSFLNYYRKYYGLLLYAGMTLLYGAHTLILKVFRKTPS